MPASVPAPTPAPSGDDDGETPERPSTGADPSGSLAADPPYDLLRPRRAVTGMSAVLLPFTADGSVDWEGFEAHVARTASVGLVPAVNMDTGYVQLLDPSTRAEVLARTASILGSGSIVGSGPIAGSGPSGGLGFVAGAYVPDAPGDRFDPDAYRVALAEVASHGGTPVLFPSHGLNALDGDGWVEAHAELAADVDRFIAFELGPQFVPYGRIYPLDAYEGILGIERCIGAKHSSLRRDDEWRRIRLRDRLRPGFMVLTGNDLAVDMVRYGSDYLLGLSTMAPDAFAERDRRWQAGDPSVHELDDVLSYLGAFTFRAPVPGYRHDAARVMALRGWLTDGESLPAGAQRRPDSDIEVLAGILERLLEVLG